jgi:hypothetical protein
MTQFKQFRGFLPIAKDRDKEKIETSKSKKSIDDMANQDSNKKKDKDDNVDISLPTQKKQASLKDFLLADS